VEHPAGPGRPSGLGCYLLALGLIAAVSVGVNVADLRVGTAPAADETLAREMLKSPAVRVFLGALMLATVAGLVILATSIGGALRGVGSIPPPPIQPSVLLIGFLVFLIALFLLSGVAAALVSAFGVDPETSRGAVGYVVVEIAAILCAFTLSFTLLSRVLSMTGEDIREMGWRCLGLGRTLVWGAGGYMAALPLLFAGLWISQGLFRNIETPQHPIVDTLLRGGTAFWLAAVLAVVIAPIVEETCFRGMLYGALRSQMGVWPASAVSAAFFAAMHPTLPAGFLPILALGVVLAVLRERTGSLVPSMVCHAINNAVALALVRLLY
jgi:membrane protease YdiL (CAAX protease family)